MVARVTFQEYQVEFTAEGASWNPDVADDLIKRTFQLFEAGIRTLVENGIYGDEEE
jgi:hypothetical protein